MSSNNEDTIKLISSDSIHNKNCFNYLRKLKLSAIVLSELPDSLADRLMLIQGQKKEDYDETFPYADLYTEFFDFVEENIKTIYDKNRQNLDLDQARIAVYQVTDHSQIPPALFNFQKKYIASLGILPDIIEIKEIKPTESTNGITFDQALELKVARIQQEIQALDDFIVSIYDNDNSILEDTFDTIKDITLAHTPVSEGLEKKIERRMSDTAERINLHAQSPAQAGSAWGRFTAMISDNFKPQHTTSLSTVRHYQSNENSPVREYRFGTQGQRHEGKERVSPLFERFLEVQQQRMGEDTKISHIYFNNLGRDRNDAEGLKERALTVELEALETKHKNVAVITLPADKGLMDKDDYKSSQPEHHFQAVKNEFLLIAQEDPNAAHEIKDFHISNNMRKKIFCNPDGVYSPEIEKKKLEGLLDKSFQALGIKQDDLLSDAQRQAVWFHFIKFELTNHIIERLKPESINFSCKDAIDRGGVSSAYYNLIKSFEPGNTAMTRVEFDRALHAAPAMVKARGMNHHAKLIWNTVDAYLNNSQNYLAIKNDPTKAWLIEWRDFNCPHERVESLLHQRMLQFKEELNTAGDGPVATLREKGLKILDEIDRQSAIGVSGKRLLLEAAARTTSMALDPTAQSPANMARYKELTNELSVNHPKLQFLCGMMKVIAGVVLSVITLGKKMDFTSKLISSGIATANASLEADSRKDLQKTMKENLSTLKDGELDADNPGNEPISVQTSI